MGGDGVNVLYRGCEGYFNPRPRVGGDYRIFTEADADNSISTHAPAWGATQFAISIDDDRIISTHAPAWGATIRLWGFIYF